MDEPILEVKDLYTHFFTRRGVIRAVDGVSFKVKRGETLGLVGESGCGKSITCLSIIRLVPRPAGQIVHGQVIFNGEDLIKKTEREIRRIRGEKISMILQDPMTSLDPLFSIGEQVAEPIRAHQQYNKENLWTQVKVMLEKVRIPAAEMRMREYPHQMSGGMRQRIVGAIALSCQPDLLIADEPTTALDVTIQAQFLRLLKDIQEEFNVSMIMITHDFGIVAKVCDRVAVMYAGKIVESASVRELFNRPLHPYTIALINALPKMEEEVETLTTIEGQPPNLLDPPSGCRFAQRCVQVQKMCLREAPELQAVGEDHEVSCWKAV
jgi:oligopeptide/dipeptide ABC transporter ATP-binding protein